MATLCLLKAAGRGEIVNGKLFFLSVLWKGDYFHFPTQKKYFLDERDLVTTAKSSVKQVLILRTLTNLFIRKAS